MHCGHASRPVILCFASFFRQIAKILQTWGGRGLESTGIDSLGASAVSLNGLESTGIGSLGASAVSSNEFSMSFNLDITKEAFVSILRTKNLIICLCFAEAVCTHVQNSFRCICMKTGKLHIRL